MELQHRGSFRIPPQMALRKLIRKTRRKPEKCPSPRRQACANVTSRPRLALINELGLFRLYAGAK